MLTPAAHVSPVVLVQVVHLVVHEHWGAEVSVKGKIDNAVLVSVTPIVIVDRELVNGFTPLE